MNDSLRDIRRRFLKALGTVTLNGTALPSCRSESEAEVATTPKDLHVCTGRNTLPVTRVGTTDQAGECQCASIEPHASA